MAARVIWLVIDSVGIGEMPDAGDYGDEGSNTLENLYRENPRLKLPNLEKMGLGLIEGVSVIPRAENPVAAHGKAAQMSPGKDTTTGHWEMAGIVLEKPFPLFPDGFPPELIKKFESKIGRKTLGNYPASGTEIINVLGDEHVKTGSPIVYTSGDSVFQIAAHEDVIFLEELYRMCETAREMLSGDLAVGRVIARPFTGKGNGNYARTRNRHDYSLSPYHDTVLNMVERKGIGVYGVGKIFDIFAGSGITKSIKMKDNKQGMEITMSLMKEVDRGLIFVNLVDFDMIYGHRNDVEGYSNALMDFDEQLGKLIGKMDREDVLVINADHGCDPTTESTNHSREYVPVLVYGDSVNPVNIGVRKSFSDIGQTIAEFLQTESIANGESFAREVLKKT